MGTATRYADAEVHRLDEVVSAWKGTVAATLETPSVPDFARRSDRLAYAGRFARDAYEGHPRATLAHPVAVAALIAEARYPEHVVLAALLHDIVEDTPIELDQLSRRFGADVCALVARLTEDDSIRRYPDRKADLRERAAASDDNHAAAIFAADKLASARALNDDDATIERAKLEHYERTVRAVHEHHPHVPFLAELSDQVGRLRKRVAQ